MTHLKLDFVDAHAGLQRAVTLRLPVLLAALHLEDADFLPLRLGEDDARDGRARDVGLAGDDAVVGFDEEDAVEGHVVASRAGQTIHGHHRPGLHLLLPAAGLNNGKHHETPGNRPAALSGLQPGPELLTITQALVPGVPQVPRVPRVRVRNPHLRNPGTGGTCGTRTST